MSSRCLITFDLNTNELEEYVKNHKEQLGYSTVTSCYMIILKVLEGHGFERIHRSVYFGYEGKTQAHGTIALQKLAIANPWFIDPYVTDIRFLEVTGCFNAQFIIDGVTQARVVFEQRIALLRQQLLEAGLETDKIEKIINQQKFAVESVTQIALPKPDYES